MHSVDAKVEKFQLFTPWGGGDTEKNKRVPDEAMRGIARHPLVDV